MKYYKPIYLEMPFEAEEGVFDTLTNYPGAISKALSLSEIEVLDLIGEGKIKGLVSGEWSFSGVFGEVGWRAATFKPFPDAPGLDGIKYLRSIYWNDVPVINSTNKYNFQRVDVSFTPGFPNGSILDQQSPELTVSRTLNERLRGSETDVNGNILNDDVDFSKVYRILNPDCKAAIINIKVNRLASFNDAGETNDSRVDYKIFYRPIFASNSSFVSNFILAKTDSIQGKVNNGYIKSSRVDFFNNSNLPYTLVGWEVKIVRLTPDSLSQNLSNQTVIDSLTEIYSDKFVYPNSAIVRQKFDAQFFSQIPTRAFHADLLEVQVPSNYEPRTKSYVETSQGWDGTFSDTKQWTDNPAWCYYDLITNNRYGLGKYIKNLTADKWGLYEISKYCDTLVYDGYGNLEPRFTCNVILNSRDEAYKVVNDMASIFRGISYYSRGSLFATQDRPITDDLPVMLFTNANVENGDFIYSSSAKQQRHTVAVVRYNDKFNLYKPAIEYVEDFDGIRRYGIKEMDMTAFGSTSRGQAVRLGRWALLSETLETETIKFNAGLDCAAVLQPGSVFQVFDSNRKITRFAGRTLDIDLATNSATITLDDRIPDLTYNSLYTLTLQAPTFNYDPTVVTDLTSSDYSGIYRSSLIKMGFTGQNTGVDSSNRTQIYLPSGIDTTFANVQGNLLWTIEPVVGQLTDAQKTQYINKYADWYRVINIRELEINKYEINGLQYHPDKYAKIESGLDFVRTYSDYAITPTSPSSISVWKADQNNPDNPSSSANAPVIRYSLTVPNYNGVTSFKIYSTTGESFDNGALVPSDDQLTARLPYNVTEDSYLPDAVGFYQFRAYSFNDQANLISTGYVSGGIDISQVFPVKDIQISSLMLSTGTGANLAGTRINEEYFIENPTFTWQVGYESDTVAGTQFDYRITIRQPSLNNTPSTNIYYEEIADVRPGDLRYTFDFDKNQKTKGGPYRTYDVVVEAIDSVGDTSAGNHVFELPDNLNVRDWELGMSFSSTTNQNQSLPGDYATNGNGLYYRCIVSHTSSSSILLGDTAYWSLLSPQEEDWSNAKGYDILGVDNRRISGFYVSTGGISVSGYKTEQWINPNGDLYCYFKTGIFPPDAIGGYLYCSTGQGLNYLDWATGKYGYNIFTGEFSYDVRERLVKAPSQLTNVRTGYFAFSLYDSFDKALKDENLLIPSGLYISNTSYAIQSGSMRSLDIMNDLSIFNFGNFNEKHTMLTTRDGNSFVFKTVDHNGGETIISSQS